MVFYVAWYPHGIVCYNTATNVRLFNHVEADLHLVRAVASIRQHASVVYGSHTTSASLIAVIKVVARISLLFVAKKK